MQLASVRRTCVQTRRRRIYEIIDRAAQAASKDQMNELYNISRILAPRQRRERVKVRAADGSMLTPHEQFLEIERYFRQAFASHSPFSLVAFLMPLLYLKPPCNKPSLSLSPAKRFPWVVFLRKSGRRVRHLLPSAWRPHTRKACAAILPVYPRRSLTVA